MATSTGTGEYLYQRTHGMIGSLSHLIRGAAIDAILDGTERITKAHLDAIRLDHTAESAPAPAVTSKRSKKTQATAQARTG